MVSVNSTSLLKSFGFVAVCQFILLFVCVLGAPYGAPNTHTNRLLHCRTNWHTATKPNNF